MAFDDLDLGLLSRLNAWTGNNSWSGTSTFNGNAYLAAGLRQGVAVLSGNTTISLPAAPMIEVSASSGAITITLPNTNSPGSTITLVKTDASSNAVTITPGVSLGGYAGSVKLYRQGDLITIRTTSTSGAWSLLPSVFNPIRPAVEVVETSGTPLASDTVSGTTTETAFGTQLLLKANNYVAKSVIKFEGFGSFAYSLSQTQQPRVRVGPTATAATSRALLIDGGAISALTGTTGALYQFDGWLQYRSVGTTAQVAALARLTFVSQGSGQSVPFEASGQPAIFIGTSTIDSTVDNMLCLTVQESSAAAGNSNTLQALMGVHLMPSVYS